MLLAIVLQNYMRTWKKELQSASVWLTWAWRGGAEIWEGIFRHELGGAYRPPMWMPLSRVWLSFPTAEPTGACWTAGRFASRRARRLSIWRCRPAAWGRPTRWLRRTSPSVPLRAPLSRRLLLGKGRGLQGYRLKSFGLMDWRACKFPLAGLPKRINFNF